MVVPCPKCKTNKFITIGTHGQYNQCYRCGEYVRKPFLFEELKFKTMNEQQTLKVMILDFAYWLEANKHITNDADSLVNEYIAFIDKQIGGVNNEIENV